MDIHFNMNSFRSVFKQEELGVVFVFTCFFNSLSLPKFHRPFFNLAGFPTFRNSRSFRKRLSRGMVHTVLGTWDKVLLAIQGKVTFIFRA